MTEVAKILEYKRQHDAVAKCLQPEMEESMKMAREKRTQVSRTIARQLEGHTFICHIRANGIHAQVVIFKLIPTEIFFESIAYDPGTRMYYLIRDHVFERYKERQKVKLESPRDILYHYVHLNPFIAIKHSNPNEPEGRGVTAMIDKGVIYGEKLAANILNFRTFICHHMLSKKKRMETRGLGWKYRKVARQKSFNVR